MKKIIYSKSNFIPVETNSIGKEVVGTVEQSVLVDEIMKKGSDEIKDKNGRLTTVLNSSNENLYTEPCHEDDEKRISTFVAGRELIKAYTYWYLEPAKKEAAEVLLEVFNRHWYNMKKKGMQRKTSVLYSFIDDIDKTELTNHFTTLGMIDWKDVLINDQIKFDNTYKLKVSYNNNKESLDKNEAHAPVADSIEDFIDYLNSTKRYHEEDSDWMSVYNDIDAIIKNATTISRSRRSHNNNKSDDE